MCDLRYQLLILCLLGYQVHALTCRSEGGPKESDLKNIYKQCLKMQDGKNSSLNHNSSSNNDWKDSKRNQRNDWESDQMSSSRGRDDHMGSRNDRRGNNENRRNNEGSNTGSYDDRMGSYDNRGSYDDRMGSYDGRMGGYDDRRSNDGSMSSYSDRMGNRDSKMGRDSYGRDSMGNHDSRHGTRGHDYQHDDFGNDFVNQYEYQSSTQSSRRYKRERRTENSGQRSQFNPNSARKSSGYEESFNSDEKNSSESSSSKEDEKKACALHCFLENLEMTAEDGMPDRYLVTHTLTKDVTNEDLKDFLQESIEECFQILDNENTEDKCEFSKNLLMCLSEKGRANCDDWKDDLKF